MKRWRKGKGKEGRKGGKKERGGWEGGREKKGESEKGGKRERGRREK